MRGADTRTSNGAGEKASGVFSPKNAIKRRYGAVIPKPEKNPDLTTILFEMIDIYGARSRNRTDTTARGRGF
jgi:hypothetical protein